MPSRKASVTVFDLAAYLLTKHHEKPRKASLMTALKIQKLVYYCQAWYLVWKGEDSPIFTTRLEAWINGPVSPELFAALKGKYSLEPGEIVGNPENLDPDHREIADRVLDFYGDQCAEELAGITHQEQPWIQARQGIAPNKRGRKEITHAAMERYYSALSAQNSA